MLGPVLGGDGELLCTRQPRAGAHCLFLDTGSAWEDFMVRCEVVELGTDWSPKSEVRVQRDSGPKCSEEGLAARERSVTTVNSLSFLGICALKINRKWRFGELLGGGY
jgi:hypothetical protein